jgi:hypothetical protein
MRDSARINLMEPKMLLHIRGRLPYDDEEMDFRALKFPGNTHVPV